MDFRISWLKICRSTPATIQEFVATSCNLNKLRNDSYLGRHVTLHNWEKRYVTTPLEGEYFMTDRLKSAHTTVPYVQPCLVIYFSDRAENRLRFKSVKKKLTKHKLLAQDYNIFSYHVPLYCAERFAKQKNVIYCINLSSKINYE